jgi:flavin-dependent dehydrogenase
MVMRERLDAFLVEKAVAAGAVFRSACTVSSLSLTPEAVFFQTPEGSGSARYLVACDGAQGVVASQLRLPPLAAAAAALEGEAWFGAEAIERFQGKARFDFGCVPGGYGWVFPKRDHLSLGVLSTKRRQVNLRGEYERYCQRVGLPRPDRESRRGHVIPLQPRRGIFARPRVLWAGDAAGLVDPVFAEGITGAVKSGRMAACAIAENFDAPQRVSAAYKAHLERELLPDLRIARWLALVLYRLPRIRSFALVHRGERLTHFASQVAAGDASYRQILARAGKSLLRLRRGD